MPKTIADQLRLSQADGDTKKRNTLIAQEFESVTVLFADIVGLEPFFVCFHSCSFTTMSSTMTPEQLVLVLNTVFSAWDKLTGEFGIEKIKVEVPVYLTLTFSKDNRRLLHGSIWGSSTICRAR